MMLWIYTRHPIRITDIMFNPINHIDMKTKLHLIQSLQTVLTLLTSVTVSMKFRMK